MCNKQRLYAGCELVVFLDIELVEEVQGYLACAPETVVI